MISTTKQTVGFIASLSGVLRDFAAFAGSRAIWATILVVCGAVLEALSLVMLIPLLTLAFGASLSSGRLSRAATAGFQWLGVEQPLARLSVLLGVFGLLLVARAIVISMRDVMVAELQTGFVESLRLRVADLLVAAPWEQLARLRHTRITHLMSGEIQRIGAMMQLFLQGAVSCIMLLAQCALVLFLAPVFAASALLVLCLSALFFLPLIRRAHVLGGVLSNANLSLLDSTAQFLGGLKLAVSQNLQGRFITEFRQSLEELTRRQIDYIRQQSRVRTAVSTLSAIAAGVLVLIGFGAFHLAPTTLIALVVVITRMMAPIGQIQQTVQQLVHLLPAYQMAKQLEAELAAIPTQRAPRTGALPPLPDGPIVADRISFRYAGGLGDGDTARGIEGVSLTIAPAEVVGITGPSGAGKTTLADILVGLFPPQEGRITVGGMILDGPMLPSWRDRVSYISQDPFLFHDTVRRNLNWVNPQLSDEEIWDALSLVGADTVVRGMASGLDTPLGERGTLVSGGERQRIALARAILRRPRLLVLDESTGAIDVDAERRIFERLRRMSHRPAIVVIAHRLESLTLCDRVIRLEAGRCLDEAANPALDRLGASR
jgi:ATP-binding cassette subfamily C protein